jgi:hypothetical protein
MRGLDLTAGHALGGFLIEARQHALWVVFGTLCFYLSHSTLAAYNHANVIGLEDPMLLALMGKDIETAPGFLKRSRLRGITELLGRLGDVFTLPVFGGILVVAPGVTGIC